MADENTGAVDGGDNANVTTETNVNQDGGDNANVELEQLREELKTRDRKINELLPSVEKLKEIESQRAADELAKKTAEERVAHFEKELNTLKRERTLESKLSGLGVSVEEAKKILDGSAAEQADALANLLQAHGEKVANTKLNEFKQTSIASVDREKPSVDKNQEPLSAFERGMQKALNN